MKTEATLAHHPSDRLVGTAPAIEALRAQICRLAAFDQPGRSTVPTCLIEGETGTGKGLVARTIHDSGPRAAGPFVPVNCAAIPETMLEAELFGFEAGSFTDARRAKPGLFEAASGGTLFLDEIDALTMGLQAKLLTAIESKQVRRLGAVAQRSVDVKLLAATQADLRHAVQAGRFREDLYHRLAVLVLTLPPLRDRGADVVLLAQTLLRQLATSYASEPKVLTADALAWLRTYHWPGNVRELGHVMERLTLLRPEREVGAEALAAVVGPSPLPAPPASAKPSGSPAPPVDEVVEIRDALQRAEGNVVRAARLLGISRDAVRWRMKRHGIERRPRGAARVVREDDPGAAAVPRPRDARRVADAVPGVPRWEQKTVAVLAIEITWPEGDGRGWPASDPWTEAAEWERSITERIAGLGGVRVQRTPSLDLWVFGVPRVLDQLPERALHAALAVQREVGGTLDRRPATRLAIHLGAAVVHAGALEPMAELLPVGETLALPVRLLAACEPGGIVVSSPLERRLGGWVALEARELAPESGLGPVLRGHAVRGLRSARVRRARAERRVLGPFVGRTQELGILRELVSKAERGSGQVAGIVGEPGSGKSRLLYELRQSLRGRRVVYVEGHCLAYASLTPYFPLVALVRDFCRVTETDSGESVAARLRRRLRGLAMTPELEMPMLLQMMGLSAMTDAPGLDSGTLKARVFDTLREILLNLSRRRPIVLAIENVHWIDPTSEAFFDSLTEHLATAPLLLLMTYRPGYRPSWLVRSWANQIALHPLSAPDSQRLVRAVMGDVPVAADLETEILATAEGNPFFLEELARTLLDHGDRPRGVRIPNTIHAVIEARIDRLAPEDKRLLQTAAVIGREVPLSWLQPVVGLTDDAVREGMARLQTAEFLSETRVAPDRVYAFRHALIQAVAYATLVPAQRRALHESVLDCVTRLSNDRRADHVGQLAHHAARAEAWDRAAVHYHRAAEAAWTRAAHREAAQLWSQACEALRHLPEDRRILELEADVRFGLAHALSSGGELVRGLEEYGHAEAAATQLGDPRRLAQIAAGLAYVRGSRGDHAGAVAAGERAMASAVALGDLPLQVWTGVGLGREYFAQGEYRRGIERTRRAVDQLRNMPVDRRFQTGSLLPAVGARTWLALCHGRRGEFGPAVALVQEAVQIADAVGAPLEQVWAYFSLGRIHLGRGEFDVGERYLSRALPLCEGRRFPLYLPRVLSSLGVALLHQGQPVEGLALLERAVNEARAIGMLYGYSMILTHIGDAHLEAGRLAEARRPAEEALQIARAHGERGDEAWILRLVGGIEAAERAGSVEHAAAGLDQALARAEALEMRPLVARCHLELGVLYRGAGRPEIARRHLERAVSLLRAMEMTFWLVAAERELAALR